MVKLSKKELNVYIILILLMKLSMFFLIKMLLLMESLNFTNIGLFLNQNLEKWKLMKRLFQNSKVF
jgi:hypothetical protein